MLFDLWNAFENRLPASFVQAKILEIGDLLFSMQVFFCATSVLKPIFDYVRGCFTKLLECCLSGSMMETKNVETLRSHTMTGLLYMSVLPV